MHECTWIHSCVWHDPSYVTRLLDVCLTNVPWLVLFHWLMLSTWLIRFQGLMLICCDSFDVVWLVWQVLPTNKHECSCVWLNMYDTTQHMRLIDLVWLSSQTHRIKNTTPSCVNEGDFKWRFQKAYAYGLGGCTHDDTRCSKSIGMSEARVSVEAPKSIGIRMSVLHARMILNESRSLH